MENEMVTARITSPEAAAPSEHDPVLLPFLLATDVATADVALTELLAEHVEPRLREIVDYKLRSFAGRAHEGTERSDVYHEILVQLLTQLNALRAQPQPNVIRNFRSYVAVTAYRACYDVLRRKYPRRYSLKHKLRYTLTHDRELACWPDTATDEWVCGLATWRGNEAVQSESRLQAWREQAADVLRRAPQTRLPELLKQCFQWTAAPLALDDLTGIIGNVLSVQEPSFTSAEDALAHVPAAQTNVADELSAQAYLRVLWQEIRQMTPRHCAALLLNLRDEQGGCALDLLVTTGVTSFQQIATAMELTETELAALWQHLPLEDAVIAERLGLTRQQVINLRRSARERLARRLQQAGF